MNFITDFKTKLFSEINSVPESLNRKYYPSIDGLRGLAILSVILYHTSVNHIWNVWTDGTIGVHVFFIISGFLITTLLLKERVLKGKVSFKNFYIRRALRIFPVAYLYIFILIILGYLFHAPLTVTNILTSVLYLKNFPTASTWQTGHFWTLSVEEQFYLIVPFILIANTNRYIKIVIVLFILVQIVDYVGFNNIGIFYTNRFVHTLTFIFLALLDKGSLYIFVGSLFSLLIFKKIIVIERFEKQYYLSAFLFLFAALIHFVHLIPNIPYLSPTIFAILMGWVITINLYENNFLTKILGHPILIKLGILSYSLYIWQQLFTTNQFWRGQFKYSDSIPLNLAVLFIVAFCSYYFFEVKFLKLKKQFKVI
ncbi:peptidoglycan/LPS O-acetylase OafA/YrhL [Mucilaginibacter frigoritolerans]|uniref:Peptidoglycan/LPS O-acetylase OafA/YrhL n=1 Tax=Mucilaginibacter frigoritolerans TaxID=652788 RepID=A0A562UBQ8_9SPHI|nr:acyltransferase [Mucilaginibacter frigoritolerans]TWJ03178.1 peptidoglycan/LPS O-acetylase OafA/YrhL [Mucilaginibacter frigoritolerans]